jgi:transcriptional regulator of arginine metabolism
MQARRPLPHGGHTHVDRRCAQSVAVAIDKAQWPEVVGTLSGDDTIFIATEQRAGAIRASSARLRETFGV